MAKGTEVATPVEVAQVLGEAPENIEWETAHVEAATQIKFDNVGDKLIGKYAGHDLIYPEPDKHPEKWFIQLKWVLASGEAVYVNAGYDLANAYTQTTYDADSIPTVTDRIPLGTWTATELRKLVDVDQNDPMKSYRVDVAKANGAGNQGR